MIKMIKILLLVSFFCTTAFAQVQPPGADSLLRFIKMNKSKTSLFVSVNDTTVAALNENKLMPLAGTVQLMVAIEFAKQASKHVIDDESYVALSELEKYYLPNTDGNAHPDWLSYEKEKKHIKNDSVKLIDVARGMMMFNSDANTEYLMDVLGFDNVKNNIQLFGLKQHTAIFPLVSSFFMFQNPNKLSETKVYKALSGLSEEEYCKYIFAIHNELKYSPSFKTKFRPKDFFSVKMQKMWNDRLTASTTKEYVQLVKILNKSRFLDEDTYGILAEVLEFPMENKAYQDLYKHYGAKGGSTTSVFTRVVYLTKKNGDKMEFAFFFKDLDNEQQQQLKRWINSFETQLIFDRNFRQQL